MTVDGGLLDDVVEDGGGGEPKPAGAESYEVEEVAGGGRLGGGAGLIEAAPAPLPLGTGPPRWWRDTLSKEESVERDLTNCSRRPSV